MNKSIAIIGGGPAGLMVAETLTGCGAEITIYDAKPSVGRKFLRAGVGGLNLTHSESFESFLARYTARRSQLPSLRSRTSASFSVEMSSVSCSAATP